MLRVAACVLGELEEAELAFSKPINGRTCYRATLLGVRVFLHNEREVA
jgi:hypothetical protein